MKKRITITFDDTNLKSRDVLYYALKTDNARCNHGEEHPQMLITFTNNAVSCMELTSAGNYTIKVSK